MHSSILPEWVSTCWTANYSCSTNSCGLILGKKVSKRTTIHFNSKLKSRSALREFETFVSLLFRESVDPREWVLREFRVAQIQEELNGPNGSKLWRSWKEQAVVPSIILKPSWFQKLMLLYEERYCYSHLGQFIFFCPVDRVLEHS